MAWNLGWFGEEYWSCSGGLRVLRNGSGPDHSILPSLLSATLIQGESSNDIVMGERGLSKIMVKKTVRAGNGWKYGKYGETAGELSAL
jgi:hypothetical protein